MFNLFLQLCLAALCSAAPITAQDATTQYGAGGGVIGFIVLVLDILVWSKSYSCTPSATRKSLTSSRSRGPQVLPPRQPQAPVVCPRLHLPHRRHRHLLAPVRPPEVEQRKRLRGYRRGDEVEERGSRGFSERERVRGKWSLGAMGGGRNPRVRMAL
jgi:hypothetical protein